VRAVGALDGVTVLELAAQYAGPFGPALLADLGARVIKIEPFEGDTMRQIPFIAAKTTQGKESIAIDLKAPEGREIVHRLVAHADLLMHNYRPGVPERLGIDYATLKAINPQLVYLYAGAYGADGPYCRMPAYHPIAGAICGNAVQQAGAGYPPPPEADLSFEALKAASLRLSRANEGNPDPNSAMVVGTALLTGLLARERHGIGQEMRTTMLCSNAYAMSDDWIRFPGKAPRRTVDADLYGLGALYRLYDAAEGWVFLACLTDREWQNLCAGLEAPDLAADARFRDAASRGENDAALAERLATLFRRRPADAWEAALTARGVGCVRADGPTFSRFFGSDPSVREVGFIADVVHPEFGPHWRHGNTVHLSRTPGRLGPGTLPGEHSRAILAALGYDDAAIAALRERRVVNYP
jgi:crotonobetainyl-CoA:carnitine CoA-transferase CaiB-like acyl-CoA transferase